MANIDDFGKKIGGAKKELWKNRGLNIDDITDFNTAERDKYIKKDNIWIKPDYEKMLDEGYSKAAIYFIKNVRDSIPAKPQVISEEQQNNYIEFIGKIKEELLKVKTKEDIDNFGIKFFEDNGYVSRSRWGGSYSVTAEGISIISNKLFKAVQMSAKEAEITAMNKGFLYSYEDILRSKIQVKEIDGIHNSVDRQYDGRLSIKERTSSGHQWTYPRYENLKSEELYKKGMFYVSCENNIVLAGFTSKQEALKEAERMIKSLVLANDKSKEAEKSENSEKKSNRKKTFVPKQLENIKRTGPDEVTKNITGQDFIDTFNIRGGEFGNWLNDNDRQVNMNMAYNAFKDLAKALNIPDKDIAMDNKLNIAFGARGTGIALAHYEPMREVINLTKMKGAGSLAHEYFHALDDIVGKDKSLGGFATDRRGIQVFTDLVNTMKYKEVAQSSEDVLNANNSVLKDAVDNLKTQLLEMVPDSTLTPEKIEKRNELINDLLEKAKEPDKTFMEYDYKGRSLKTIIGKDIDDISKFIDENSKNFKMTPNNKKWLCGKLNDISFKNDELKNIEPKTIKVETDFYKNSQEMDKGYTKQGHGYWQSNIEMAARAFACYVQDKLQEQGIRNDYLTGHADLALSVKENGEIFRAYPEGSEREAINKAFDKCIEYVKEIGLYHNRETVKNKTLDDILKNCSSIRENKTIENKDSKSKDDLEK